jgi:hypothetical protein
LAGSKEIGPVLGPSVALDRHRRIDQPRIPGHRPKIVLDAPGSDQEIEWTLRAVCDRHRFASHRRDLEPAQKSLCLSSRTQWRARISAAGFVNRQVTISTLPSFNP